MHQGLIESSNSEPRTTSIISPSPSTSQHGILRSQPSLSGHDGFQVSDRSLSPETARPSSGLAGSGQVDHLGRGLGRLSLFNDPDAALRDSPVSAGAQRIADYENALITASRQTSRPPVAFQVVKCSGSSGGAQLTDCPNEILTQILSHLHPDSHGAVALVSKRFYALVTTPYAWRAAFLRYFPGQDALGTSSEASHHTWDNDSSDVIRSESRFFSRLTSLATWRSEYLLRTRLLRSIARGKPGGVGTSIRSSQSSKKSSAVLTYNAKLPWLITNIHGSFTGGKKGPRIVHGTADLGMGSTSDPTTGRVEKFGLDDPFSFAQLDEMFPTLAPYGVGDGPAAVPNVMDISQPYGVVGGEGFPGGRAYFKATGELRGRYMNQDPAVIDMVPEIPKIPQLTDAISSVWVAKSPTIPALTQSMIGIFTGSTLGVMTSYSVGHDSTGPRFSSGDMTARWVLSPGVPIIDIKIDDSYSQKRKTLGRVWAVALNALGEVFCLTQTPTPPVVRAKGEEAIRAAWEAGRSVSWELIESTRRTARADEFDKYAVRGTYTPRSSPASMALTKPQVIAEAQEIEKFFRLQPSHFRKVCEAWDMRRKLEVDFADGDEAGAGEAIFVITCGHEQDEPAALRKYVRSKVPLVPAPEISLHHTGETVQPSIFGGANPEATAESQSLSFPDPNSPNISPLVSQPTTPTGSKTPTTWMNEWRRVEYTFKSSANAKITATAIDTSTYAVLAPFEDPLHFASQDSTVDPPTSAKWKKHATGEIPGRRSRLLAVGTNTGSVILWNTRDGTSSDVVYPTRVIQTESPEISSLALSALYLVHGGSDGLVQAWDPLASTLDPIRTLNAKSSGRIPRHILHANPALQHVNYFAVGAIFLDPDPSVLRGVLSFGMFVRFWTYSSTNQAPGRKRRLRHSDVHGRLATRRSSGAVDSYIAAEEAELRQEQQIRSRELARLRSRFGVGLGDLTEEEAIRYAEMISEEAFLQEEQKRTSASDTGSSVDFGETDSSTGSIETVTPEPSLSGTSPAAGNSLPPLQEETDDDYEAQIQLAIRLSLMEGVNEAGQSPPEPSSGGYEFEVKIKPKKEKKKGKRSPSTSPSASAGVMPFGESSRASAYTNGDVGVDEEDDLALALRLSLMEEETRNHGESRHYDDDASLGVHGEEFPDLEVKGKRKGKWV
ncbi:F-box/WD repeat-containing protein pof10 [Rhypophila decipiens]|uniref:F-box/WD repeat-containing protein pof10 n=1 Tax=Rhypophila decipiens TaxID=261697 RepID=A0AAN6XWZ5_9PEZI|nr:F-box/WD repeat-containing protein pof10 [Rhypophila decipiens]